ncbi:MAG: chaplin [Catenulispora sp.]
MQSPMKRRIAFGLTTGGLLAGGGLGFAHADSTGTGSGTTGTTAGGSPGILSGNTIQVPVDIPINVCGVTANVVGLLNPAAHNSCANEGGATATGGSGSDSPGGSTANGGAQGSPGILSGNNVQIPVNVPVNVCGDTLSVVGVGDAAKHNHCANDGGATATGGSGSGSTATGGAHGSPGILSGNNVQIPVNVPVNVCGDSVSVVGIGDVAKGNHCHAGGGAVVPPPPSTSTPPPSNPSTPATPGRPTGSHPSGSTSSGGGSGSQPGASTGALAHTGADGLMLAPVGAAMIGGGAFLYRKFKPRGNH